MTETPDMMDFSDYPKRVELKGGQEVWLRPMRKDDRDRLFAFFSKLPLRDRRFFKHDVSQREVITNWCQHLDYDQVLMATPGKIDITDKDHSDGEGGPVYMEGVVYTMSQIHVHQTDPYNAVFFAGTEIADYIHNCEWFRQEYKAYPKILGLGDSGEGASDIIVRHWHEVH